MADPPAVLHRVAVPALASFAARRPRVGVSGAPPRDRRAGQRVGVAGDRMCSASCPKCTSTSAARSAASARSSGSPSSSTTSPSAERRRAHAGAPERREGRRSRGRGGGRRDRREPDIVARPTPPACSRPPRGTGPAAGWNARGPAQQARGPAHRVLAARRVRDLARAHGTWVANHQHRRHALRRRARGRGCVPAMNRFLGDLGASSGARSTSARAALRRRHPLRRTSAALAVRGLQFPPGTRLHGG